MDKDYLLKKWLANELTDEERIAFEAMEDYGFNNQIVENAKHFEASGFSEPHDLGSIEATLSKRNTTSAQNLSNFLIRIAAVFIVGIGLYFLFFNNHLTHFKTLASEKQTIELPDASMVTLNALSSIRFNEKKWDENRAIKLEGEAYFKVAKGKVFDVLSQDGIVSVVGTQFNVKQRNGYFEVKCFEGIVKVETEEASTKLVAGESFRIYDGLVFRGKTSHQTPEWTNNVSSFKAVPYSEVLKELERQYDIDIDYNGAKLRQLFTGGFIHGNLENALQSVTVPLELTYIIESATHVRILDGND